MIESVPERRGWLLAVAIVIAALALSASALAQPSSAGARRGRLPIDPPGHRPFVPATGDWEGTANGFPASFELAYQPRNASRYGLPPYGFGDLVLLGPGSCPVAASSYAEEIISNHAITPLRGGGSFGLARDAVTGPMRARVSSEFAVPPGFGSPGCRRRLTWRMHPAHRRPVRDGQWRLLFSTGEIDSFTVDGGGRVAEHIALPVKFAQCGGALGGVDLFVAHDGVANRADPKTRVGIRLRFGLRTARGTITAATRSCGRVTLGIAAGLSG